MCLPRNEQLRNEHRDVEPGCLVCYSDADLCINGDHYGPCGREDCNGGCTYIEPCACPCHHVARYKEYRHWSRYVRPKYTWVGDRRIASIEKKSAYFQKATP